MNAMQSRSRWPVVGARSTGPGRLWGRVGLRRGGAGWPGERSAGAAAGAGAQPTASGQQVERGAAPTRQANLRGAIQVCHILIGGRHFIICMMQAEAVHRRARRG